MRSPSPILVVIIIFTTALLCSCIDQNIEVDPPDPAQTPVEPEDDGPDQGEGEPEDEWISLFNGENLDGWQVKFRGHPNGVNFKNTFRVNDGILRVSYEDYNEFNFEYGHLFYNVPFSSYRLRVEYRFVGEQVKGAPSWAFRNNGIMLHSQSPSSMLLDQDVPICVEAQLLGGRTSGERPTMNVCTPNTLVSINGEQRIEQCINAESPTFRGDEWVLVEVIVYGDSLVHHLIGSDTVLTYTDITIGGSDINTFDNTLYTDGSELSSGYIAIQAETHPTEFRKIELLEIISR